MKMQKLLVVLAVLAAVVAPASAMLHQVTVTAGQLAGIGNDSSTPFDAYGWGFAGYDMGADGQLSLMLDLGSVKDVAKFEVINADMSSNGAIAHLDIYVASTEGGAGFDPTLFSNYDTKVFGGIEGLVPASGEPLAVRTADIINSSNRYFVFQIVDCYWGAPSPAFFSDIRTVVPEPATMCILGMGGLFALKRRKA